MPQAPCIFLLIDKGSPSQVGGGGGGGQSVGIIKASTSDFHIPFSHRQTCQFCPFLNTMYQSKQINVKSKFINLLS